MWIENIARRIYDMLRNTEIEWSEEAKFLDTTFSSSSIGLEMTIIVVTPINYIVKGYKQGRKDAETKKFYETTICHNTFY